MRTYYRLAPSVALLGTTLLLSNAESKSRPNVVRMSLAGSHLDIGQADFVKFDPKTNYYLIHGGDNWERPGASLLLCPAADVASDGGLEFFKGKVQRTTLPRLRTGWGVNIGDTPTQVRRKLGASPQRHTFNAKSGVRYYIYEKPTIVSIPVSSYIYRKPPVAGKSIKRKYSYSARYIFHHERLWAIEYRVDDPDFEC